MSMKQVMRDFLGPGKTLSWRPKSEVLRRLDRESPGAVGDEGENSVEPNSQILHYEIISISPSEFKPTTDALRLPRQKGMYQVFTQSDAQLASAPPQMQLAGAYRLLRDPRDGARYPVHIHIGLPRDPKGPYSIRWAIENRVDLRPDVIMRAMPDGVKITTKPHMRRDGTDVFWSFVAKHYDPGSRSFRGPVRRPLSVKEPLKGHRLFVDLSAKEQINFERQLKTALKKKAAIIRNQCERLLDKTVDQRLKKFNGGHTGPLPEERSQMQEQVRAAIERETPKVWRAVERKFGIKPGSTDAFENDPVHVSKTASSSPKTKGRTS
jgi:hypothetical protein